MLGSRAGHAIRLAAANLGLLPFRLEDIALNAKRLDVPVSITATSYVDRTEYGFHPAYYRPVGRLAGRKDMPFGSLEVVDLFPSRRPEKRFQMDLARENAYARLEQQLRDAVAFLQRNGVQAAYVDFERHARG